MEEPQKRIRTHLGFGINKENVLEVLTVGHQFGLEKIEFFKSFKYSKPEELACLDELSYDIVILVIKFVR